MKIQKTSLLKQSLLDVSVSPLLPYITALRPRQWTKNLIVFAAPLFAFSINLQSCLEPV